MSALIENDISDHLEKLAQYFISLQKPSGGFSSGDEGANYRNSDEAIHSLGLLSSLAKTDFFERINLETLENFINSAGSVLSDVAYSQQISIAAGIINKHFEAKLVLENESGEELTGGLLVGTRFRPTVRITGYDGLAFNRFQVDLKTLFGKDSENFQLVYSKEKGKYSSIDIFDTGKNLGEIKMSILARFQIATVGVIALDFTTSRTVGYRVNIVAKAHQESTGKDINVGEIVSVGTTFSFEISLDSSENKEENFDAIMNVVDSSGAIIQSEEGNTQGDSMTFRYSLDKVNIPSGSLNFFFEISNGQVGFHSRGEVSYQFSSTMVASEINFLGSSRVYKIGQRVEVRMVPASFDLRNIHMLDQTDFRGNNISREIFMDVMAAGSPIHSIRGLKQQDNSYLFSLSLVPRLDNFGDNAISFRYLTRSGQSIDLRPFDSENNELYDDLSQMSFSVPSDLHIIELTDSPKSTQLSYGDNVEFRFKLRDENSGQIIKAGSSGSNVYLSLIHKEESGNTFTSITRAASQTGEFFEIDWAITPNAISGAAEIILFAQGINSQRLDIHGENGQPVTYAVQIGGTIDVTKNVYSASVVEAEKSTVIASFSLSCQGVALRDALLYASFQTSDGTIVVPHVNVASFGDSYQVSLSFEHSQLPQGSYQFNFYPDLSRSTNEQSTLSTERLLFVISFDHQGSSESSLPFSPQLVISALILGGFIVILFKRNKLIEKNN